MVNDGLYKYVKLKDGRLLFGHSRDTYHIELVERAGYVANADVKYKVESAGFFIVDSGQVSVPEFVDSIDSPSKHNRSIGLDRWADEDDITAILEAIG